MKFKNITVYSDDPYYDLFSGGDIDPLEILEEGEELCEVLDALDTITDFLEAAERAGVLVLT